MFEEWRGMELCLTVLPPVSPPKGAPFLVLHTDRHAANQVV